MASTDGLQTQMSDWLMMLVSDLSVADVNVVSK